MIPPRRPKVRSLARPVAAAVLFFAIWALGVPVRTAEAAGPEGQVTYAFHVTLAPRWLDPGETESAISPFKVLYAIHDALVKPMPQSPTTPSLAESWSVAPDGTSYEFLLRQGIKFHNGDAVTSEDVKFSFDRYRGGAAKLPQDKVKDAPVADARPARFPMKEPWPDFMTFYRTTATGAGWVVPQKYRDKAGAARFTKAPPAARP